MKIVRPFNNYGPGLKITDRRVLPDFFNNVLSDKDIVLLSDGRKLQELFAIFLTQSRGILEFYYLILTVKHLILVLIAPK